MAVVGLVVIGALFGKPPSSLDRPAVVSAQPIGAVGAVESGGDSRPVRDETRDLRHAAAASFGGSYRAKFVRVQGEPSFGRGLLVALDSAEQPGQQAPVVVWLPESLVHRLEGDGTLPWLIQSKPLVVVALVPGVGEQPPGATRLEVEK